MSAVEDVAFVKRGKNRATVFRTLTKPSMPSELVKIIYGKTSNTHFNIVSRALAELTKEKLVKILNKDAKTGRMYCKTKRGLAVDKQL